MTITLHRGLRICLALLVLVGASSLASAAFTQFATPLLSVDLNGGNTGDSKTNLGWDGVINAPVAPGAVVWTPWGGALNQGGDGAQLPNQDVPVTATSINKNFGVANVTISIPGLITNYAGSSLRSRDRGDISTTDHGGAGTNNQFGRNLYRDFVHGGGTGSNVAGTNFLQIDFAGLLPNTPYAVNLYSYDRTGPHTMHFTKTAPTTELGNIGWFVPATNTFQAPADVQIVTWVGAASIPGLPAPALMNVTSNGSGAFTLWAYGKGGTITDNNADTSYLNGFQLALVPEPATAGLAAMALSLVALRRRRVA